MIVFFDSNVHISLLLGSVRLTSILEQVGSAPIRLSPIVASELLQGSSGRSRGEVEKLIAQLLPIEGFMAENLVRMRAAAARGLSTA